MSSSRSRSDQTTSLTTTQTSENLNVQDVEGITLAGNEGPINFTQLTTDHNAVGDATALARRSVEAGETIAQDSMNFTRDIMTRSIGSISEAYKGASVSERDARESVADAYIGAFGGVRDVISDAFSFVGNATERQQDSLAETVSALTSIGKEQNTSSDQRIADISAGAQKNLIVLVGIVGVAAIAFLLFKGK